MMGFPNRRSRPQAFCSERRSLPTRLTSGGSTVENRRRGGGRMAKAPAVFSRGQLRGLARGWVIRQRALVIGVSCGIAFLCAAECGLVALFWRFRSAGYLMGFLNAGTLACGVGVLTLAFLAREGDAIFQMRGAWGEENTRDALKRARRRGLVWGSIDGFGLQRGDVDHLVVTRRAGVFAIDSKWRNRVTADELQAMAASANRARIRGEGIANTLVRRSRGSHRGAGQPLGVRAAVVVWGAAQDELATVRSVDGVDILAGRDLLNWLANCGGFDLDRRSARQLLRKLGRYRDGLPATK